MKTCIAVIGKNCSGKETFFKISEEVIKNNGKSVSAIHFSDPLNETLDAINKIIADNSDELIATLPKSRYNQQQLSRFLREIWGQTLFARAVYERAVNTQTDFVFLDGIRRPADARMLRRIPNSLLIFIQAPLEVRYERSRLRNDRAGDAGMTFEEFCKRDRDEPEQLIEEVAKSADFTLDNFGNIDDLRRQVQKVFPCLIQSSSRLRRLAKTLYGIVHKYVFCRFFRMR